MATYTFEGLSQTYGEWRAPTVRLKLGGRDLTTINSGWWILEAQAQLGVEAEAGVCSVTVGGVYDAKNSAFNCGNAFVLGTPVTASFGYVTVAEVFRGYLHTVSYEMGDGQGPSATLYCMDVKGAMMGCGLYDYAGGATYREVIGGFFSGKYARGYTVLCSAPAMDGAEFDRPVGYLPAGMDDYGFFIHTARRFGLEFFVSDGKLLLRKKPASGTPLLTLTPTQGIFRLRAEISSEGYLKKVVVRGGNDDERDGEKKVVTGTAENAASIAPSGSDAGTLLGERALEIFDPLARDDAQAQELATARLRARQQLSGEIEVTTQGIPELCAGKFVELGKLGAGLNGTHYISGVTHRIDDTEFRTTIRARRL